MHTKKTSRKNKTSGKPVKRVALLLESGMAFDRSIARGVGDYIRSKTGWIILLDPMMEVTMESLKYWNPDGIIASIHLPAIQEVASLKQIPTVGVGGYSEELDSHLKFPIVTSNQHEIGQMAGHAGFWMPVYSRKFKCHSRSPC
jgi:hypothetical protein